MLYSRKLNSPCISFLFLYALNKVRKCWHKLNNIHRICRRGFNEPPCRPQPSPFIPHTNLPHAHQIHIPHPYDQTNDSTLKPPPPCHKKKNNGHCHSDSLKTVHVVFMKGGSSGAGRRMEHSPFYGGVSKVVGETELLG